MKYNVTLCMGTKLERASFDSVDLMFQYVRNSGASALVECVTGEAFVFRDGRMTSSISAQGEHRQWVQPTRFDIYNTTVND